MNEKIPATNEQLEKLRIMFTEAMNRAGGALKEMLERKVSVNLSQLKILPLEEVPVLLEEGDTVVNGVHLDFTNFISGSILLYFPQESALILSDLLLERPLGDTGVIYELEQSALKEVGNILTNIYVDVIAEIVGVKIIPSLPYYAQDMLGAIVDSILVDCAKEDIYVLFTETDFELPGTIVKGHFLFFSSPETLEVIVRKITLKESR